MSRSWPAAALAGALSLFLPLAPSHAQEEEQEVEGEELEVKEVILSGKVVTEKEDEPLAEVRIELFKNGVELLAFAETDEQGYYSIPFLPEERAPHEPVVTYDLRALGGYQQYLAGFARDLVFDDVGPHIVDFDLVTVKDALFQLEIEEDDLFDTDGDDIPDALEKRSRCDEEKYDTNDDGQPDGLSVWVGADPIHGPQLTEENPGIIWPPGEPPFRFPMLASGTTPPLGLLFRAVPGATGYRVTALAKSGRVERSWDHDVADGELLFGGGLSLRWMPPAGWKPGIYELVIQGYYGLPDEKVGEESRYELELFDVDDLDDLEELEIVEEQFLYGLVVCSSLVVRERGRLIVPAGETLHLVTIGDVVVERDAFLVGAEGAPGGSIVISAGGDVIIHGTMTAGAGEPGEDEEEKPKGNEPSIARAKDGASGGQLMLFALGEVVISSEGRLASGDGGAGGNAEAKASEGEDALAVAGRGGVGGRLVLHSSTTRIADRAGILTSGAGGPGGTASAQGGDGGEDQQAGLSSALAGAGGSAGSVWLCDWDLRRDGYVGLHDESFPLKGGIAGEPGESNPTYGAPGRTSGGRSFEGRAHEVICTEAGGSGWYRGGEGQPAIARGGEGLKSGDGGAAMASAAPGGGVSPIGIPHGAFELIFGYLPVPGPGGRAEATGGMPGPGGSRIAGEGGSAKATGGRAGFGRSSRLELLGRGGEGGQALAIGQHGLDGASRCPGRGLDGSDGGSATAIAGAGGFANYRGGNGGNATAQAGDGGDGGMGHGGGMAGAGGNARGARGEMGHALYEGKRGDSEQKRGQRGSRGPTCPN